MKSSARITALSATLALACASQAMAGKRISTDQDWHTTGVFNSNANYQAPRDALGSMEFNPLGSTPMTIAALFSFDFGNNDDYSWFSKFKTDIDEDDPNTSNVNEDDHATWNFLTWKLTRSETEFLLDSGAAELFFVFDRQQSTWTFDFNYYPVSGDADSFPIDGASFKWNGITYTADQATLSTYFDKGHDFTLLADGTLQPACWWTNNRCPVSVPDASGPASLGLLAGALGLGFALRRRRLSPSLQRG